MVGRSLSVSLLFVAWLFTYVSVRPTSGADLAGEVESLLQAGWKPGTTALDSANEHYIKAQKASGSDMRVHYAMVLVHIKHRKYAEAKEILKKMILAQRSYLPAWKADIWISVLNKKYGTALGKMQGLSGVLASDDGKHNSKEALKAKALFLGQVLGFLNKQVTNESAAAKVKEFEGKIKAQLPENLQKGFSAGLKKASDLYDELKMKQQEQEAQAEIDIEAKKEEEKERLANKAEQLKGELDAKQTAFENAQEEYEENRKKLEKKAEPLQDDLSSLENKARPYVQRIQRLQRDRQKKLSEVQQAKDKKKVERLQRDIEEIDRETRREQESFNEFNQRAAKINRQLDSLKRENLKGQQKLLIAKAAFNRDMKRLKATLKIAESGKASRNIKTSSSARARSLAAKLKSFRTYVEIPLDAEKQQLIEALR